MKKIYLLPILLMFINCTADYTIDEFSEEKAKKDFKVKISNKALQPGEVTETPFDDYVDDALKIKAGIDAIYNGGSSNANITTDQEARQYIENYVASDTYLSTTPYINFNYYDKIQSNSTGSISETNLDAKAKWYFNELERFNANNDYQGMLNLLDRYKKEYNYKNYNLEALAGVFALIEVYSSDLNQRKMASCAPEGRSVASAAIGGAIAGARVGFLFGSFLGPAGTAAGTAGGAIVGAITSSIMSVGIQGIACELGF